MREQIQAVILDLLDPGLAAARGVVVAGAGLLLLEALVGTGDVGDELASSQKGQTLMFAIFSSSLFASLRCPACNSET